MLRHGNLLQNVHLTSAAPYSEDINLVAVGERPGEHIRNALMRAMFQRRQARDLFDR